MDGLAQLPGFFGKLPSHGDFVARRLPPSVRLCFDHWLQGALVQSRVELGEAWLPTWLSSPLWRFVAGAGVCGEQGWAGVMMPSHDRVGRCFPLLLMAGSDGSPSLHDCLSLHDAWFERLEDLALSTLEGGFALEAFDAALMALDGTRPGGAGAASPLRPAPTPAGAWGGATVTPLPADALGSLLYATLDGHSAWWTDGSPAVTPCLAVCGGMPAPAAFAALLDGRWAGRGWELLERPRSACST